MAVPFSNTKLRVPQVSNTPSLPSHKIKCYNTLLFNFTGDKNQKTTPPHVTKIRAPGTA